MCCCSADGPAREGGDTAFAPAERASLHQPTACPITHRNPPGFARGSPRPCTRARLRDALEVLDLAERARRQRHHAHGRDAKQVVRGRADDGARAELSGRLVKRQQRVNERQQDLRRRRADRHEGDVGDRPVPNPLLALHTVARRVGAHHDVRQCGDHLDGGNKRVLQ
eukprot:365149-Chlamydomonas_euryale.AAC.5